MARVGKPPHPHTRGWRRLSGLSGDIFARRELMSDGSGETVRCVISGMGPYRWRVERSDGTVAAGETVHRLRAAKIFAVRAARELTAVHQKPKGD